MPQKQICPECARSFLCGGTSCWCLRLPAVMLPSPSASCLCPPCLAQRIHHALEAHLASLPPDEALQFAATHRNTSEPLEFIDYHREAGSRVFTRWYLLKRGQCCGENCRHCPFPAGTSDRDCDATGSPPF